METLNKIANLFFPVYMLIYFLGMFGIQSSAYVGYPIVSFVVIFAILIMSKDFKVNHSKGRTLLYAWMIYNVASVIMYLGNGLPLQCYVWALKNYFFSIMFFFIGNWPQKSDDKFYDTYMLSCAFFLVVGLYLYYVMPSYYISYLQEANERAWYNSVVVSDSQIIDFHRFSSFTSSSYVASALSVCCMICASGFLIRPHKVNNTLLYGLLIIGFLGAMLCQQRIAMVCSFIVLIVFSIYGYRKHNKGILGVSIAMLAIGSFVLGLIIVDSRIESIVELINLRFDRMDFNDAMSQREWQIDRAKDEILTYLFFGKGMGAGGHSASMYGGIGIHDNGYYQLLLEYGVVGTTIFIFLLVNTVIRGIRYFKLFNIEVSVVVYFLLCNIGADVFSLSYIIVPIFWFCLGRIWNISYYHRRLIET